VDGSGAVTRHTDRTAQNPFPRGVISCGQTDRQIEMRKTTGNSVYCTMDTQTYNSPHVQPLFLDTLLEADPPPLLYLTLSLLLY
jgi:hypothetical protein